ncbi:MAG TPA: hypothetical protein VK656_06460 [Candidatus Acidoferrum sp.]|nr:hypothetical protein [Candidatus Acidoferrum sp.]
MNRRASATLAAIACLTLLLAGCGSHGDQNPTPPPRAVASHGASGPGATNAVVTPFPSDPYGSPPVPDSPVAGVVLSVDSGSAPSGSTGSVGVPTSVRGFMLRSTSGVAMTFTIGQVDDLDAFPLSSLADHQDSQVPVLVWFRQQGSDLVVYHLEDAP